MLVQPGFLMSPSSMDPMGAAKTEADFNAHIAALAVNGVRGWSSGLGAGAFRVTAGAATGLMYGSSWLDSFYVASAAARVVQHALPSAAVFAALTANAQQIFLRCAAGGSVLVWNSTNRNGYASIAEDDGIADPSLYCTEYLRWDRALGRAFRGRPNAAAAEVDYDWD